MRDWCGVGPQRISRNRSGLTPQTDPQKDTKKGTQKGIKKHSSDRASESCFFLLLFCSFSVFSCSFSALFSALLLLLFCSLVRPDRSALPKLFKSSPTRPDRRPDRSALQKLFDSSPTQPPTQCCCFSSAFLLFLCCLAALVVSLPFGGAPCVGACRERSEHTNQGSFSFLSLIFFLLLCCFFLLLFCSSTALPCSTRFPFTYQTGFFLRSFSRGDLLPKMIKLDPQKGTKKSTQDSHTRTDQKRQQSRRDKQQKSSKKQQTAANFSKRH